MGLEMVRRKKGEKKKESRAIRGGPIADRITSTLSSTHSKVFVFDPTDITNYVIPIGKQTRRPEHIFYRPCSGIWQTVWLESAPAERITQLDVRAAADGALTATVHSSSNGTGAPVALSVLGANGSVLATGRGTSGEAFTFQVPGVRAWTPSAPTLYNLTVTLNGDDGDVVSSYTGFRTVGKAEVDGVLRPTLNGEFVFQFATLDQGYWPDGIYTPPTYEAMVYDLRELKKLGFNTVRKHVSLRISNRAFLSRRPMTKGGGGDLLSE